MKRKYTHITYEGRKIIEKMTESGSSVQEMADVLGVHRDTIYRELRRGAAVEKKYSADVAQQSL